MTSLPNLVIDPQKLWDDIMETAKFGATQKGGIRRLTLTDEDKRVRDWFKATCEGLGCTVTLDSLGNMFAVRPGKRRTCCRSRSAPISTPSRPAASSMACSACSAPSRRCARWWRRATRPTRRS